MFRTFITSGSCEENKEMRQQTKMREKRTVNPNDGKRDTAVMEGNM
jgi:hypothetical protein